MRTRRPALHRIALLLGLASALGCSTTYVGDPGPRAEEAPICDVNDTRPGCRMESPVCQEANEYLCDPL